jgi:hypothetical protein
VGELFVIGLVDRRLSTLTASESDFSNNWLSNGTGIGIGIGTGSGKGTGNGTSSVLGGSIPLSDAGGMSNPARKTDGSGNGIDGAACCGVWVADAGCGGKNGTNALNGGGTDWGGRIFGDIPPILKLVDAPPAAAAAARLKMDCWAAAAATNDGGKHPGHSGTLFIWFGGNINDSLPLGPCCCCWEPNIQGANCGICDDVDGEVEGDVTPAAVVVCCNFSLSGEDVTMFLPTAGSTSSDFVENLVAPPGGDQSLWRHSSIVLRCWTLFDDVLEIADIEFQVELADVVVNAVEIVLLLLLFVVDRLPLVLDRGLTSLSTLTSRFMTSSLDRKRSSCWLSPAVKLITHKISWKGWMRSPCAFSRSFQYDYVR